MTGLGNRIQLREPWTIGFSYFPIFTSLRIFFLSFIFLILLAREGGDDRRTNVRDPILEGSSIIGLRYFYLLETFHIPFLPRYFLFSFFFLPFRNKSLRTKQPNGSSKQAGWKEKIEEKKIRFIFEIRNLRIHALSSVKKREKESICRRDSSLHPRKGTLTFTELRGPSMTRSGGSIDGWLAVNISPYFLRRDWSIPPSATQQVSHLASWRPFWTCSISRRMFAWRPCWTSGGASLCPTRPFSSSCWWANCWTRKSATFTNFSPSLADSLVR